jgi:hypothetical protein
MRLSTLLLVTLGLPVALAAQLRPDEERQFIPVCDSTHRPVVDSSRMLVALDAGTTWKDRAYTDAQRGTIRFYADAIRQHFRAPESLGNLPVVGQVRDSVTGAIERVDALSGSLLLVVKSDGSVTDVMWETVPFSVNIANAVFTAAEEARTAGDFLGMPRLRGGSADDTVIVALVTVKDSAKAVVPLMRVAMNSYVVDSLAMVLKAKFPVYPRTALSYGADTKAMARWVIGSDGQPVASTVQITRTDWRDFVAPIRTSILTSRYIAARSGGCAVPFIVEQPYQFEIRR